ncbi:MAG: TldD/PmbA family protein [Gemmatimonadetes bacterium]|nr:TldD/PmbA family protein [Gemmatimonadota bacterium]
MSAILSRDEAKAITDKVLGFSRADACRVSILGRAAFDERTLAGLHANTRFAGNAITTSGESVNVRVRVRSAFGRRSATLSTNILSDEGLRRSVETSERLARLAPEDPEAMPELEPQAYREVPGFFERTAGLDAERRAAAVMPVLQAARRASLQSAGFLTLNAGCTAVANSRGLFGYHRSTAFSYTTTVRTPDGTGSGWAGAAHNDWSRARPQELAHTAIAKARLSQNPVAIEPGPYTVVLEATAVANLLRLLLVFAMGARPADEGRSFFSKRGGGNKIGERVVDERVTLVSDPWDPDLLASPFDGEGQPSERVAWIENGVLRNLMYDRYWAEQRQTRPTGFPAAVKMTGGTAMLDDLIRSTERGILVTRFWYIRGLDPRTVLYTGLTRDGTFLIENGRIARPVKNLRFNESPVAMLNNLDLLGQPMRVSGSESGDVGAAVVVPPIKTREFHFQSVSDAV